MTVRWCFCDSAHKPTHQRGTEDCEHAGDADEVLTRDTQAWLRSEGTTQPVAAALLRRWLSSPAPS